MLNDRDPNLESPKQEDEESEYHFSDEDVSYELEDDETPSSSPKQSAVPPKQPLKDRVLNRLNNSKRMIVVLVIFLILVFAVYKMVVPSTSQTPGNIQPAVVATNNTAPRAVTTTQTTTTTNLNNRPQEASVAVPQTAVTQTVAPTSVAVPVTTAASSAPTANNLPAIPPPQMPTPQPQTAVSMPAVIPVQSQVPTTVTTQQSPPTTAITAPTTTDANQLMANLENTVAQRMNDFATQNKNVSDEVQMLNSRVASLEAQINQLSQQLSERARPPVSLREECSVVRESAPAASTHVGYSVQAIIPGRAWLRAEDGETVTVTEGDSVRGLGRITKIDPYDGVVEVNTGTKVISVSYGSGT